MKLETLNAIREVCKRGCAIVRAINRSSGEECLIDPALDTSVLGLAAARASRADQSMPVNLEGQDWFLSVYNPPLDLVIVGAVHIAQALSAMAGLTGYNTRIIDPRVAFATADRFPGSELSHDWPEEALAKKPLGRRSALVALTHDPKIDDPALTEALASDCFYIGALGSRKTHAARLERLAGRRFSDVDLARIHGPVGLAIGARSPAEIAVSILAEMTLHLRTVTAAGHAPLD